MKEIFSKQNKIIKELKKQKQKNRFLLFLDNQKSINDAINFGFVPKVFLVDKDKMAKLGFDSFEKHCEVIVTNAEIIKDFSGTVTPQGIVAVFEYQPKTLALPKGNFLVLDGLQDTGNIGTLLRSALGANFKDVFLVDCAAVTNDKVVRSSMASIFNLNIFETTRQNFLEFAQKNNLFLVCADMNGQSIFDFQPTKRLGVVVGSEGQGVSQQLLSACKSTIKIPMHNNLESLNAAVAGSIIMFEIENKEVKL